MSAGAGGPGGGFWWCDPFAPTANRTGVKSVFRLLGPASPRGEKCRLGQRGASGRPQPGRPGRAHDGVAGLAFERSCRPGCRRYGEQTLSQTHGRDINSSTFFLRFFLREGKDTRGAQEGPQPPQRRADGKSISMISALQFSCYAGRKGKNKTEGLQYLEVSMATFCLAHQGNFPDCSDTNAVTD